MDCCTREADRPMAAADCPACGKRGRRIKPTTLDALLRDGTEHRDAAWRFCATPGCEVAWFGEETGRRIPTSASRVPIFQKEVGDDRPICYCFSYSVADVRAGVDADGRNAVADEITEHCRRGEDRCEHTNPQGACCLGNVQAIGRLKPPRA